MPACVVRCPKCGAKKNSPVTDGNVACPKCGMRFTIRNGRVVRR